MYAKTHCSLVGAAREQTTALCLCLALRGFR